MSHSHEYEYNPSFDFQGTETAGTTSHARTTARPSASSRLRTTALPPRSQPCQRGGCRCSPMKTIRATRELSTRPTPGSRFSSTPRPTLGHRCVCVCVLSHWVHWVHVAIVEVPHLPSLKCSSHWSLGLYPACVGHRCVVNGLSSLACVERTRVLICIIRLVLFRSSSYLSLLLL
jgi:hypothetical protein